MSKYRFHLQKYSLGSKIACPSCERPRCFVKYVDKEGVVSFSNEVGKCDHEISCGYHYTPRDFFRDNPNANIKEERSSDYVQPVKSTHEKEIIVPPSFIPLEYFNASLAHFEKNPLYKYLCRVFGEAEAQRVFHLYHVGTSAKWGGATVFWQIDANEQVRSGKIILYNSETGHRVKEPHSYVSWAHRELQLKDFNLKQCLFGEHLLIRYPDAPVILVESEKTAIVMSHFIPNYVWVATGGINGCFKEEFVHSLKGRDVTLIPDLGATQLWKEKSQFIEMFGDTHMRSDHSRQWKEVVEIINGKDYKSIQVEDGGYPVYGTGGEMARASDYLSPANSILLGRKGTIDKPLLIREKYWNVDTAFGAVPDEKVLHYVYFYWHCKTIDFNVLNKGTTLPSTTKVDLLNLWIKIPSMEEQTRFGSIVEQADKSEFVGCKSQFFEMFEGDEYPLIKLGDYTDLTWGDTNTTKNSYVTEGYLAYSASGPDGKLDHYDYDCEGIVLSAIGADCGKTWFASGKWSCIKNTIRFWSTFDDLDNRFLYFATREKDFWPRRGGAQPFIPQGDARNCSIPLPPICLQRKFVEIAEQADKSEYYN